MLKYAALLFNTIALLIYHFFFAEGITVTQNLPATANADDEFTVELVINKGSISGFAKLQQDLPEGFTAVSQDNNGGTFTFSNQSVKFIWMSLPADKEFRVKYKVKVAAGISGEKTIAGKFSYVSENVKQSVEIAPAKITIGGSSPVAATTPATTTTEPVATNNTPATIEPVTTPATTTPVSDPVAATTPVTANTNTETSSIVVKRNVPDSPGSSFTVEILVNKGTVSGFAKLLETLPTGFTATAGESAGGSFSFADQKVKFVWVSMPSQPEFRISYKVSVDPSVSGPQAIDGVFSYIENDETKKHSLATTTVNIGGGALASGNETKTTTSGNTTAGTNNTQSGSSDPVNTNTGTTNTTANTTASNNSSQNSGNNQSGNTTASNSGTQDTKSLSATSIPAPQGNVVYKVQVAALRNAVDANTLAARYNLNERISTEMADGLTKYTVGSHNEYRSARDSREQVKNKGVVGPFVTAYNGGRRITVQEALMISNQKWYR